MRLYVNAGQQRASLLGFERTYTIKKEFRRLTITQKIIIIIISFDNQLAGIQFKKLIQSVN